MFNFGREGVVGVFPCTSDFVVQYAEVNFDERVFQGLICFGGFHKVFVVVNWEGHWTVCGLNTFVVFDELFRNRPQFGFFFEVRQSWPTCE